MIAKATITLDEAYYLLLQREWLRYVSKWRRWEVPIGVTLIIGAVIQFLFTSAPWFIPTFCLVVGIGEILDYFYALHQWKQQRMSDEKLGETVSLIFEEEQIRHSGPLASGEFKWEAIQSVVPTPTGLFLRPQTGLLVYVPDHCLDPIEAKEGIVARIRG